MAQVAGNISLHQSLVHRTQMLEEGGGTVYKEPC